MGCSEFKSRLLHIHILSFTKWAKLSRETMTMYINTWEILYSLYVNIQWNLHLLSWLHSNIVLKKMVKFNDITFFN